MYNNITLSLIKVNTRHLHCWVADPSKKSYKSGICKIMQVFTGTIPATTVHGIYRNILKKFHKATNLKIIARKISPSPFPVYLMVRLLYFVSYYFIILIKHIISQNQYSIFASLLVPFSRLPG